MKISVITVCYQAVGQLAETMESVLQQTYPNLEYIIVDGGSTDGTLELINKTVRGQARVVSEPDHGIYDAMNKGVRLCQGEYVVFMNAGDRFVSQQTVEQVAGMASDKREDILYGNNYDYLVGKRRLINNQKDHVNSLFFLMSKMICHQAIFAKREWLLRIPFDTSYHYAADRKWLIQCVKANAVLCYVPVEICIYDRAGTSSLEENFERVREEIDRCLLEEYPVRARMLLIIKKNKKLREWIRHRIFRRED